MTVRAKQKWNERTNGKRTTCATGNWTIFEMKWNESKIIDRLKFVDKISMWIEWNGKKKKKAEERKRRFWFWFRFWFYAHESVLHYINVNYCVSYTRIVVHFIWLFDICRFFLFFFLLLLCYRPLCLAFIRPFSQLRCWVWFYFKSFCRWIKKVCY